MNKQTVICAAVAIFSPLLMASLYWWGLPHEPGFVAAATISAGLAITLGLCGILASSE